MAAATSDARTVTRPNNNERGPRNRVGKPVRKASNRSVRTPTIQHYPASPVADLNSPINGHLLSLVNIDHTLYIGKPLPDEHLAIYEALIRHKSFPNINPLPNDTTLSYINRALGTLQNSYSANFDIAVARTDDRYYFHGYQDDANDQNTPAAGVFITANSPTVIDITTLDRKLRTLDPELTANLMFEFCRSTNHTYEVFGPADAISLYESLNFGGDANEWLDHMRYQISDAEHPQESITYAQIRRYMREYDIRTPGMMRRQIGAHHARFLKTQQHLSLRTCRARIDRLPDREREIARVLLYATITLITIGKTLHDALTPHDCRLFDQDNEASMATPGLILDNTGDEEIVNEVLNDFYQDMQGEAFGLNYALALDPNKRSIQRFFDTLALFQRAHDTIDVFTSGLAAYNESHKDENSNDGKRADTL